MLRAAEGMESGLIDSGLVRFLSVAIDRRSVMKCLHRFDSDYNSIQRVWNLKSPFRIRPHEA